MGEGVSASIGGRLHAGSFSRGEGYFHPEWANRVAPTAKDFTHVEPIVPLQTHRFDWVRVSQMINELIPILTSKTVLNGNISPQVKAAWEVYRAFNGPQATREDFLEEIFVRINNREMSARYAKKGQDLPERDLAEAVVRDLAITDFIETTLQSTETR